ncbi:MAG: DUF512 domain-containing protein [Actinobacteria bacterium]|nr:DUF512 domain-containing protein [Actinomycetota bacterium]
MVEVRENSPCRGAVEEGDLLLAIAGRKPRDFIDCMEWGDAARVRLTLQRGGRDLVCEVRKEEGVPLGLVFDEPVFDGVMTCRNRCRFCFVDQMPPGLRPSLYVKDDDYRLSFYYGNFITLNNLGRGELRRIERLRLSPLYVSLHATDARLRSYLMGGNASRGLEALARLLRAGLEIHLQVVACPGINDGEALRRTCEEVLSRYTAASLGVVPVGLTRRAALTAPGMRTFDAGTAAALLEVVHGMQERALELHGRRIFHAADEFYLLAGEDFPEASAYEGYPQLENGVGMARKFLDEGLGGGTEGKGRTAGRGLITGEAGENVIRKLLERVSGGEAEVVAAQNLLFGGSVTVTSLLGGGDILSALRARRPSCHTLLIPENLLREGRFLDDMTLAEVEERSGYRLLPTAVNGRAFLEALTGR